MVAPGRLGGIASSMVDWRSVVPRARGRRWISVGSWFFVVSLHVARRGRISVELRWCGAGVVLTTLLGVLRLFSLRSGRFGSYPCLSFAGWNAAK